MFGLTLSNLGWEEGERRKKNTEEAAGAGQRR